MSIRLGNSVIASGTASDNKSITANTSNELQTVGVINQNAQNVALKSWMGTLAEYNALVNSGDVDENTIYNITDDMEGGESVYTKEEVDEGFLGTNKITNCITEIPQDIKLELNNGTLTLKAGSRVYYPNGFESDGTTPKFDVVTVSSDLALLVNWGTTTGDGYVYTYSDLHSEQNFVLEGKTSSGSTAPTQTNTQVWYDTTENKIKRYASGSVTDTNLSFPLAKVHIISGVFDSIDQTFNGFGYIGSTAFVLPGVKGLVPNGRNADGTLKNIEFTIDSVKTATRGWNRIVGTDQFIMYNYEPLMGMTIWFYNTYIESKTIPSNVNYTMWYNPETNICKYNDGELDTGWIEVKSTKLFYCGSDGTTNVNGIYDVKQAFHALDYSDSSTISGWSMPSDKYVDLTLGASDTVYTAPANGFIIFRKSSTSSGQFLYLANIGQETSDGSSKHLCVSQIYGSVNGADLGTYIPVKKGDHFIAAYSSSGTTQVFRFVYAEGEI